MKFARYILSLIFVVGAVALPQVAVPVRAHKFHTSFAEAEYNVRARSLEITLRTFPDDLELLLGKRRGKSVRLDHKQEVEPLLVAYLQETFQLRDAQGQSVKLSWVGMDAGVDSAWLYFEARLPDGLAGAQLKNQFLFDLYDDQINLVNIKQENRKRALTFKNGATFQALAP